MQLWCVILVQQQITCTWLLMVPSSWKQQMCLICSLFLTLGSSNILLGTLLQRYLSFVDLYPDSRTNLLIALLICSDKIIGITYCHVLFFTPQKVTDPYISLFHCFSCFMVSTNVIFPFSIVFLILWFLQMYKLLPSHAKWSFRFVTNLNFRHLRITRNLISRLVLCNIAELSSPGMMMSRNVRKSWGESSLMIRFSLVFFSPFLYIFVIISLHMHLLWLIFDAARWA